MKIAVLFLEGGNPKYEGPYYNADQKRNMFLTGLYLFHVVPDLGFSILSKT